MRMIPAALLFLSACTAAAPATSARPAAASAATADAPSEAERVVRAQWDAFNRRDVEAFMATYAPTAVMYEFPGDTVFAGEARIRWHHSDLFGDPDAKDLHAEIHEHVVKDRFVIDHVLYSGLPGEGEHVTVVIFEVRDGRIQNEWSMN